MAPKSGPPPAPEAEPAASTPEALQSALDDLMQILAPLTGDIVDLDLFVGQDVAYGVVDSKGERRQYVFPADPPFEIVMAFFDAYDSYEQAEADMAIAASRLDQAKKPAEIARLRAQERTKKGRYVLARRWTLTAFLELVRIRQPDTKFEDLSPGIGATALAHWMKVVIFRLNQARLLSAIASPASPAPPKVPEPRAVRRAQKRRR